MSIPFVYTGDIHTPKHLIGKAGDVKELSQEDADLLKEQGYGYIESEGPITNEGIVPEIEEVTTQEKEPKDEAVRNKRKPTSSKK